MSNPPAPAMNRRAAKRSLARELWRTRIQLAAERAARRAAEGREATQHYNATHDPLTGLLNRRGLYEQWPTLAPDRPTVAVLDLDGFKQINDTYGHAAGNIVLTTVARRLSGNTRCRAVARWGGDEFVLAVHGTTPQVHHSLRGIDLHIGEPIALFEDVVVRVATSIGVFHNDDGLPDLADLIDAADAAMYRAKRAKRGSLPDVLACRRADIAAINAKRANGCSVPAMPYPVSEVAR